MGRRKERVRARGECEDEVERLVRVLIPSTGARGRPGCAARIDGGHAGTQELPAGDDDHFAKTPLNFSRITPQSLGSVNSLKVSLRTPWNFCLNLREALAPFKFRNKIGKRVLYIPN